MKKKLLILNGTMGVGKTATCQELYKMLPDSVWLDGDWCWMMHPFQPTEYNKKMVIDNITHLLRNFLLNPSYEHIIFSWVVHLEEIYDMLLNELCDLEFEVIKVTLICSEACLTQRIQTDIDCGTRDADCIEKGLERLSYYHKMNTYKIDTTGLDIRQTAGAIANYIIQHTA